MTVKQIILSHVSNVYKFVTHTNFVIKTEAFSMQSPSTLIIISM